MIIRCTNPCLFENDGQCTLTHVASASEPSDKSCAYYKKKGTALKKEIDPSQPVQSGISIPL
jgi:hypothetical protein